MTYEIHERLSDGFDPTMDTYFEITDETGALVCNVKSFAEVLDFLEERRVENGTSRTDPSHQN